MPPKTRRSRKAPQRFGHTPSSSMENLEQLASNKKKGKNKRNKADTRIDRDGSLSSKEEDTMVSPNAEIPAVTNTTTVNLGSAASRDAALHDLAVKVANLTQLVASMRAQFVPNQAVTQVDNDFQSVSHTDIGSRPMIHTESSLQPISHSVSPQSKHTDQAISQHSQPSVPQVPTLVVNMPSLNTLLPVYSGLDTESPLDFFNSLEEALRSYKIPEQNWSGLLRPQFCGEARTWYENQPFNQDYSLLKKAFLEKFNSLHEQLQVQAKYFGEVQKIGESTEAFIKKKQKLSKRLPVLPSEEEQVNQVLLLLHPTVQVLYQATPKSFSELLSRAKIIDQSQASAKPTSSKPNTSYKPNVSSKPPACRNCKNEYHWYRDCPKLQAKESKPPKMNTLQTSECQGILPRINVGIDDVAHTALLDSGAFPNFIDKNVLSPEDLCSISSDSKLEVSAGWKNSKRPILGKITKVIQLGGIKLVTTFAVVEDLNEQIILGQPFFRSNNSVLDYTRNCLLFGNHERGHVYFLGYTPPTSDSVIDQIDPSLFDQSFPSNLQSKFFELVDKFKGILGINRLGQTNGIQHTITLKHRKPIFSPPYKVSKEKEKIIYTQVREMLDQRIIEESTSPYSSPIVLVPKGKDFRFCVDYRRLNEATVEEECQRLNIKDLIDSVGNKKVLTSIDLKSGYWQIGLSEESKPLTAFTLPNGNRYQFRVLSFGLSGAPGTFMRLMRKVLEGYLGNICTVFLDDILVYSNTYEEHLVHLELILERLATYGLTISVNKCHFGKPELKYLGHIMSESTNQAPTSHVEAIQNFPSPTSKKKLQSFIGTCNWLREYLPHAAEVMAPLTAILKRKPFKWTNQDEENLKNVKLAFTKLEPLSRPQDDLPMILQCDASGIGMAATLYQERDGKRFIISNSSAKWSPTESKYHINEQECLALVWSVKRYKSYLDGKRFLVRTDSRALTWLNTFKEERSKLTRWALLLQEFSFDIEHIPGRVNELPDAMSRLPMDGGRTEELENWNSMVSPPPPTSPPMGPVINNATIKPATQKNKIFVPPSEVREIIKLHHDSDLYRHPGSAQTLKNCQANYTWPNMSESIREYVRQCTVCARTKVVGRTNKPCLVQRQVVTPMHTLSVDIMGPYTRSKKGKRYLLVISDTFSRWVEAFPLPQADTKRILPLLQEWFCRYGYPEVIITDNGPQFVSRVWKEKMSELNIIHHTTAIYTPRQNPVERQNQNIKTKLRMFLLDKGHNRWDEELDKILFSIRNSVCQSTKLSPAEILFGTTLRHPHDPVNDEPLSQAEVATQRKKKKLEMIERVRSDQTKNSKVRQEIVQLQPGQLVYIKNTALSSAIDAITSSLTARWIGPYKVIRKLGVNVYECQNLENDRDVRKVDISNIQIISNSDSTIAE
ncbi:hypothetical protein M8J77_005959 [Diaphorina citri]|nr:hypothetical protein M8J77_005959 [Diaphorina citri]